MDDSFDAWLDGIQDAMRKYTTDKNGDPVPCGSMVEWALWFATADRVLCQDTLPNGAWVSTVFLGIDHGHSLTGDNWHAPILWETLVCHQGERDVVDRYASRLAAEMGHNEIVARLMQE